MNNPNPFNSFAWIARTLAPLLVLALSFGFVWVYSAASNIHGDGKFHTLIAREIAESEHHLEHMPYTVLSVDPTVYFPINYPQTYHVALGFLYSFGGEAAMELSSALFAGIAALWMYYLLRGTHPVVQMLSPILAVVLNAQRFAMTPLMEQMLLALAIATLCSLRWFLERTMLRNAVLLGLFCGISAAIKQQGLILPVIAGSVLGVTGIYAWVRTRNPRILLFSVLVGLITVLVAIVPLAEQWSRNGTIGYVPGAGTSGVLDDIPIVRDLLDNRFPENPEAATYVRERVGYIVRDPVSVTQIALSFIGFPLTYTTILRFSGDALLGVILLSGLWVAGIVFFAYRMRTLGIILATGFTIEVLFTFFTQSRIEQYHVLGVALTVPVVLSGMVVLIRASRSRVLGTLLAISVCMTLGFLYNDKIHSRLYAHSGRQSDEFLTAYQDMAPIAQTLIRPDQIVLTPETNFSYYIKRDTAWLSSGGLPGVYTILYSPNESESLQWLKRYHMDFVFIEWKQLERLGLRDGLPSSGLASYINTSKHFEEVYRYDANNERVLSLYRVIP